jgi:multidrug efflux pump subunit AcrA (membrane-fusion protein)
LNESILSTLDTNLANLDATNVGGANDALILSTRQIKSQFLAATNGARQGLRNAEYQASGDKPPAQLSNLQKELALKQLDTQEKMLDLNREVSNIQLQIARVGEGAMSPSAPFAGTVQRVLVKKGDVVNPGTLLMVVSENPEDDPITAVAYVSADMARRASRTGKYTIHIDNGTTFTTMPSFISQDVVQGSLYALYFPIPEEYSGKLTEKGTIRIDVPMGYIDTTASVPYVPIDAVYQTKTQSYVFTAEGGVAVSKQVTLGSVSGSYVEIVEGLTDGDEIILDRSVVAGDRVQ